MEEVYKWCDIVDHHKLFSTHLFVLDDFYKDSVNEMKKEVENTLSQLIDQKNFSRIKKLLEYCIQTLKIGS